MIGILPTAAARSVKLMDGRGGRGEDGDGSDIEIGKVVQHANSTAS